MLDKESLGIIDQSHSVSKLSKTGRTLYRMPCSLMQYNISYRGPPAIWLPQLVLMASSSWCGEHPCLIVIWTP